MDSYKDQVREAYEKSKRTGKRVRKVFNRKRFAEEFPKMANDPRLALTPKNFILDITPLEAIDVGTLRDLCIKKGEHPLAVQKALSVQGLEDHRIVYVLKEDLVVLRGDVSASEDEAAIRRAEPENKPTPPISPQPPKQIEERPSIIEQANE